MAPLATVTPPSSGVSKTDATAAEIQLGTPFAPVPLGAKAAGITVIDWLAATAMQGLVTHGMKVASDRVMTERQKDDEMARRAYQIANAMLQARVAAMNEVVPK